MVSDRQIKISSCFVKNLGDVDNTFLTVRNVFLKNYKVDTQNGQRLIINNKKWTIVIPNLKRSGNGIEEISLREEILK